MVIWSALEPEASVEMARELNGFARAAALLTSVGGTEARVPTRIFLLPKPASDLGMGRGQGGFFLPGLRANWAVAGMKGDGRHALFHEYVHFLVHNHDGSRYPAWFHEGFAELLATMRVEGREVELGRSASFRTQQLRALYWKPFREVIEQPTPWTYGTQNEVALFYAQAWLLVHYLHWGRGDQSFGDDNVRFLTLRERGVAASEAFEQAFDVPIDELDDRIEDYFYAGIPYRNLTLFEAIEPDEFTTRPLSRGEVALGLADLTTHTRPGAAGAFYRIALEERPGDPRALAGLGSSQANQHRWDEAFAHLDRAVASAPDDPIVQLDLAEALVRRALTLETGSERTALVARARAAYERVLAREPDSPEALARHGASFLIDGDDPERARVELEKARELVPASFPVNLALAEAYLATGRPEEAAVLLDRLLTWSHRPMPEARALRCRVRGELEPGTKCP